MDLDSGLGREFNSIWDQMLQLLESEDTPSLDDIMEWEADGGCEATDGCWVESDGRCSHGKPSWLIKLGMI